MSWIYVALVGLLAGAIAGRLVKGRGFGCLGNIVVGLIGALIGGFLFNEFGLGSGEGFLGRLVTATVGAVVLLVILNLLTGRD